MSHHACHTMPRVARTHARRRNSPRRCPAAPQTRQAVSPSRRTLPPRAEWRCLATTEARWCGECLHRVLCCTWHSSSVAPASSNASVAPHTVAMDDDPSDPVTSLVTRTVYAKSSGSGMTAATACTWIQGERQHLSRACAVLCHWLGTRCCAPSQQGLRGQSCDGSRPSCPPRSHCKAGSRSGGRRTWEHRPVWTVEANQACGALAAFGPVSQRAVLTLHAPPWQRSSSGGVDQG